MIEHIPLCRQSNDPSARELDYYVDQLKYLRNLYLTGNSHIDMEAYMTFQAFLDIFGTWYNETFWNTRRIMKMVSEERAEGTLYNRFIDFQLAPACKDYIIKCTLSNVDIPCFSEDAFQDSLTKYGPCCTFNTKNK